MPSLKANVAANYFGQAYTALIGIVMLPVYVRYLGAEAYGLVGFFTMLQAWFLLLDLGLAPTLSRELSRFRAGAIDGNRVASMVRSTEWFFGGIGLLSTGTIVLAAGWIARRWLKAEHLTPEEMRLCVIYMGGTIASRWLVGLYRGGLAGLENMVVLNVAGTALATLRSVGVLAVLLFWSTRPSAFFSYQWVVATLELLVMRGLFYRAFAMSGAGRWPDFRSLRGLFAVAGSMAFVSGLWIVMNQTDKLVLSWTLDLQHYGFFIVAVTLAGGIGLLAGPMSQALQPRFTVLAAQNEHSNLRRLYRASTQATSAGAFAVAGVMACFAEPLLRAWTGNPAAAEAGARILPFYALGNAVTAVLALAFLVQFAHGKLHWHVIGNCLFAVIWFPGVYFAAKQAGVIGVGWVWLGGNFLYLVGWVPYVHARLMPGLWWRWLVYDVGAVVLAEAVALGLLSRVELAAVGRVGVFAALAAVTIGVTLTGLLAGAETRSTVLRLSRSLFAAKPA